MLSPCLLQFGAVEMAALEQFQRYFVNLCLAPIEFEFFPAVRSRTACAHLWFSCPRLRLSTNDNPRAAFRACDAGTHNAMGHGEIVWAASLPSLLRIPGDRQSQGCLPRTSVSFFHTIAGRPGT